MLDSIQPFQRVRLRDGREVMVRAVRRAPRSAASYELMRGRVFLQFDKEVFLDHHINHDCGWFRVDGHRTHPNTTSPYDVVEVLKPSLPE